MYHPPVPTTGSERASLRIALLLAAPLLLASGTVRAGTPVCGNGLIETGEACDDGAALNGGPNRCAANCAGTTPAVCGNAVVEVGEGCDDGGDGVVCDADCSPASCGDGYLNEVASEVCDDGVANGSTSTLCTTSCTLAFPSGAVRGGTCGVAVGAHGRGAVPFVVLALWLAARRARRHA